MISLLNLQLNPLKKSSWCDSDHSNCGKLCISGTMCIHSAFEIAKSQRHLPDGHQRLAKPEGSAQATRSPFAVLSPLRSFTPNMKAREWQATQSVLSRTASKQAKTSRLKALSYYSSWPSTFVECLNDDWHVHAGRTIAAASALQVSSAQVGIKISCSSQAVSY